MAKYRVLIKEVSYVLVDIDYEDGIIPSDDTLKTDAINEIQSGFGHYCDPDYEFDSKEIIKDHTIS